MGRELRMGVQVRSEPAETGSTRTGDYRSAHPRVHRGDRQPAVVVGIMRPDSARLASMLARACAAST